MKLTLKEKIEGFSQDAEYRAPKKGEHYLIDDNDFVKASIDYETSQIVLKSERWRAEEGKRYYIVDSIFRVISATENFFPLDTHRHQIGNYFQTHEEAQKFADYCLSYLKDGK